MSNEIEVVSDDEGLAVIGPKAAIEAFLSKTGLDVLHPKEFSLSKITPLLYNANVVADLAVRYAETTGVWLRLTKEAGTQVKAFGLMPTKSGDGMHAMIGQPGKIQRWVQVDKVVSSGPSTLLAGPFAPAAMAAVLAQLAMQQQMNRIEQYLETIDVKLDAIARAQKDSILAELIGAGSVIEEAYTIRAEIGGMSTTAWSKVQATGETLAKVQAYALLQLDAIVETHQQNSQSGDLAEATKDLESQVREWLVVLAKCFQFQDSLGVLELDRVLDANPADLESHQVGLQIARRNRREQIANTTDRILSRLRDTVDRANSRILLNPFDSPATVRSGTGAALQVVELRTKLDLVPDDGLAEARTWSEDALSKIASIKSNATEAGQAAKRNVGLASQAAKIFGTTAASGISAGYTKASSHLKRKREDLQENLED